MPTGRREILRAVVALVVILGVFEIGFRVGIGWLGAGILLGAVAALELYRRVQRHREAG